MTRQHDEGWLGRQIPFRCERVTLDGAELWLARLADVRDALAGDTGRAERVGALVAEDRERATRLRRARDRSAFLLARSAVRTILSALLGVAPSRVRLERTALGKPYVVDPRSDLVFSTSRSDGVVAVLAGRRWELGVDIERIDPHLPLDDVAPIALDDHERRVLAACRTQAERRTLFYRCWTAKEAVLKAHGDGLTRDPRSCRVLAPAASDPCLAPSVEGFRLTAGHTADAITWTTAQALQ